MRISDWSSDVCSSDLVKAGPQATDVQRNLEAAGYEPGTDEFRQALREHMTKPLSRTDVRLPASHQETEEAQTVGEWYGTPFPHMQEDRKSVVVGKRVSHRVDLGGRQIF